MTALLIALLVLLLVLWYRADARRQKRRRRAYTALSVASRAKTLSECPPEFHARLRAAMNLSEEPVDDLV